ncbi:MAG TPA: GntR family transcriptional regulator [Acidobacteriaceae bacterium]|jgi:GntR family transcriptional regulator|nr:GntR family transcriptional regulator [Acidobacteriaceae bacterium]
MNARALPQVTPLDRGSGIPLYHQIQRQLMDRIRSGAFRQSDPMPPVQEIATLYGVSLMTARQAVRSLCDLGLAYSKQGKGTFVANTKVEKNFRQVLSFTEEMKTRGTTPKSRVLSFRIQTAPAEVRKALKLNAGEKVFRLHRVRYGDNVPLGIECSCLPVRLCPSLLEDYDTTSSLYRALEMRGIFLMTASEVVEVGRATAEDAKLLRVAAKSPVFLFTRISFLEDGKPVEFVKSTYRGDRYKIVNRLTRARSDGSAALV